MVDQQKLIFRGDYVPAVIPIVQSRTAQLADTATTQVISTPGGGATPGVFKPSGPTHATGLVVDPGSTMGNSKFLREDATWAYAGGGLNLTFVRQAVVNGTVDGLVVPTNAGSTPSVANRITGILNHVDYTTDVGAFNVGTGLYTVPVSGTWVVELILNANLIFNVGDIILAKNDVSQIGNNIVIRGVNNGGGSWYTSGVSKAILPFVVGDTVSLHSAFTTNPALAITNLRASFMMSRVG